VEAPDHGDGKKKKKHAKKKEADESRAGKEKQKKAAKVEQVTKESDASRPSDAPDLASDEFVLSG
jgi:hypothetical protein